MPIRFDRPPRILVTRADRIGDLVLSTPVFPALRRKYPAAKIACLTFLENRGLVLGHPDIEEVLLYDKKGSERGWLGNLWFASRLRRMKFDAVVHLHATNRMHLVGWLAGIPVRIGWRRKCAWALTHSLEDLKREGRKHEAEYSFDLLEFLDVPCPEKVETSVPLNDREKQSLEMLLRHHGINHSKPWIIIHPGASCPSKVWPAEKFRALIGRLFEKYDAHVITVGARQDRRACEESLRGFETVSSAGRRAGLSSESCLQTDLPASLHDNDCHVTDLSGRVTLGMLAWLLKDSALLISNDSGPVHVATAVGTPVVSIFGRNQPGLSPARWRPLGQRSKVVWKDVGCRVCLAHRCRINFLCLDAISADEVFAAAKGFLR
ncbi:MAG: glycosyltransferase family 9 protein [Candidatus Omnitrophota bacterium]|jgi:heptosyltransferase-2